MKIFRWLVTGYCSYFCAMTLMMILFGVSIDRGLLSEIYFNKIYDQNKEIFSSPSDIFKKLLFPEIKEDKENGKNPDAGVLENMDLQNNIITEKEISIIAKGIHGYISGYKDRLPQIELTIPVKDLIKDSGTLKNITDNSSQYSSLLKRTPSYFEIIQKELKTENLTKRPRSSTIDEILKNPEFKIKEINKNNIVQIVDIVSKLPDGISMEGVEILGDDGMNKPVTDSKTNTPADDLKQKNSFKPPQANSKIIVDLEKILNSDQENNTENATVKSNESIAENLGFKSMINLRGVRNKIELCREFVRNIALIFLILIIPSFALTAPKLTSFCNRLASCFISMGFLGYFLVFFIKAILDFFIHRIAVQMGILNDFPIGKFITSLEGVTSSYAQNIALIYIGIGIVLFIFSIYLKSRKDADNEKISEWVARYIKNPVLLKCIIAVLLVTLSMYLTYREYDKIVLKSGLGNITSMAEIQGNSSEVFDN